MLEAEKKDKRRKRIGCRKMKKNNTNVRVGKMKKKNNVGDGKVKKNKSNVETEMLGVETENEKNEKK